MTASIRQASRERDPKRAETVYQAWSLENPSLIMVPPEYTFDPARLAALDRYGILDTPAEPGFDDIVELATVLCAAPVALVSLVTAERQWFKARVGFPACETDLSRSVCAHALVEPDLLVIPDLTLDPRSRANPLVTGPPHIRFYAGAPILASAGEVLGSLCVIDSQPRPGGLTPAQANSLRRLARQVSSQLELRRAVLERDALMAAQRQAETRRAALLHLSDTLRDSSDIAEMIRTAATIVGQTLDVGRAGFGLMEEGGAFVRIEADWTADGVASLAGRHRLDDCGDLAAGLARGEPLVVEDVETDPRTTPRIAALRAIGVRSLVNMPVREHGRTVGVFIVHDRVPHAWSHQAVTFLRNVADRLEASIARARAESEQRLLHHELSHRLKNTFAMIQAIATQTLRGVPDQAPIEAFIRRLHALSAAHDVLMLQNWTAARIGDAIASVIGMIAQPTAFDISGPAVELGPRATLSVSLLLHELMTNAVKYGSLSHAAGRVRIDWHLDPDPAGPELVLHWRESGGPPVALPTRKGFGSKLIRMGLMGTGGVDLRYETAGFEASFRAPLAQLQLS